MKPLSTAIRLCLYSTLLVLSACSRNMSDLHAFIAQTKSSNVGSVKPIPQFQPYESFTYSAAGLRDPFVDDINIDKARHTSNNRINPDSNRPQEELENFPLDTLSMVGTIKQKDTLWGLIKDPQNVVHRVQVGNYMGKNDGHIVSIDDSSIHLVEIVPDGLGGYIERDASIAIGGK